MAHRIRVFGAVNSFGHWGYRAVCSCGSETSSPAIVTWHIAMAAADWHRRALRRQQFRGLTTPGVP